MDVYMATHAIVAYMMWLLYVGDVFMPFINCMGWIFLGCCNGEY